MRNPRQREADLRAQLAAGPRRRRARGRPDRALRDRRPSARASTRRSTTPSAAPARGSPSSRTATREATRRARGGRRRPRAAPARDRVDGDELTLDFTGSADQHDGNLNCPLAVTLSACYFALRVLTDPDVPPCAGRLPAADGGGARGLAPQRPAAGRGRGRQRGDLVARRRPRARRLRARARPGHDEQPHARQRRLHLLRDARRRPGRLPGRRRPERACTWRCRTRSTRRSRRSSSSSRCARWSTRCGAARAASGRHRGGDGVVRELEALDEMRFSLITERRRHAPPGADGGEPGAPGRNLLNGEELPAEGVGHAAARRQAANRDPRRWRTWQALTTSVCAFLRPRDHGRADGREPRARRLRADRLEPHAREGRALRRGARRAARPPRRAEAAEGASW